MEKQSNTRLNMAWKDPYVYSIAGLLLRTVYYIASIFMKTEYNIISLFDYLVDLIDNTKNILWFLHYLSNQQCILA